MQERYGRETQQAVDSVVSQARSREAELIANIQNGAFSSVFQKRLKEASLDAEGTRQVTENWKGRTAYWEDRAAQAEQRLAESSCNSGANTLTF